MSDQNPKQSKADKYERFTALLVANQPAIHGFICSLLANYADTEDVLQKTSLVAWQKFDQFDESTKFSTWACQIAYFEVKNFLRTSSRDRHVFSDEVLQALADEGRNDCQQLAEERVALSHCIKKLEPFERDLLRRCYRPGTKIKQVAEVLGRTSNSLYKLLNTIRRRLLACITRQLREGGAE